MESTLISHVPTSQVNVDDTKLGFVVLNYLLANKIEPNANVVFSVGDNQWTSFYGYDLVKSTLADIPQNHVIITHDTFADKTQAYTSIAALYDFISKIEDRTYDEEHILGKVGVLLQVHHSQKRHGDPVKTREYVVPSRPTVRTVTTPIITNVVPLSPRRSQGFVPPSGVLDF